MIGDRTILTITGPYPEYCTKKYGKHHGIDFAARPGEDFRSLVVGEVVWIRNGAEGGKSSRVKIKPDGLDYYIYYVHCFPAVEVGQSVLVDDVIGQCDLSGRTTGGHLHYEVKDLNENILEPLQTITAMDEDLKFQFQKGEWDGRSIQYITETLNPDGWNAIRERMA